MKLEGRKYEPTGAMKIRKRQEEKACFLSRLFSRFHCARGFIFLSLKFRAETSLFYCVALSQNGCRADRPAEGVRGERSPLLRSGRTGPFPFLKFHAETVGLYTQPFRGLGPGMKSLACYYSFVKISMAFAAKAAVPGPPWASMFCRKRSSCAYICPRPDKISLVQG